MKLLVVEVCHWMFQFTRTVPDVMDGVVLFPSPVYSVTAKVGAGGKGLSLFVYLQAFKMGLSCRFPYKNLESNIYI